MSAEHLRALCCGAMLAFNLTATLRWAAPAAQVGIERPGAIQAGGIIALVALLSVLLLVAVGVRRLIRRPPSDLPGTSRRFAFSVSVGNALMDVGAILQPDRPNVESMERALDPTQAEADRVHVGDGRVPRAPVPPAANDDPYRDPGSRSPT